MNFSNIPKLSEVCASPIKPFGGNETTGPPEQIRDPETEPRRSKCGKKIPACFKDCVVAW